MAYDAPQPEQFADAEGYIDWSDYDYAYYMWKQSIPDLFETWCPQVETKAEPETNTLYNRLVGSLRG